MRDDQPAELTGYTCPPCGGMLSRRTNGNGSAEYQCRIGHAFTPAQVWIEHCAMRNRALGAAARALAENGVPVGPCGAAPLAAARTLATRRPPDARDLGPQVSSRTTLVLIATEGESANPLPVGQPSRSARTAP